jgi:hypothetical protein
MGRCCCGTSGEPTDLDTCNEIRCIFNPDPNSRLPPGAKDRAFMERIAAYLDRETGGDPVPS